MLIRFLTLQIAVATEQEVSIFFTLEELTFTF